MADVLLEVNNLVKYFPVYGGVFRKKIADIKAVDGISFKVRKGQTFGLVGESGSGKTTTARTILLLEKPTDGKAIFMGKDLFSLSKNELKELRKHMQLTFQDPMTSLDPRMPIFQTIAEPLEIHTTMSKKEIQEAVYNMLKEVGIYPKYATRYPHEFSGGQRQRIGLARALILRPSLIFADEPVASLDMSVRAQILNLMKDMQEKYHLTYVIISHDLSVIKHMCDYIAVMYLGKIVEMAPKQVLFESPLHPYTKALLSAIPIPDPTLKRDRIILKGTIPSPINPPPGCNFHPRCPFAMELCTKEEPEMIEIDKNHYVACWLTSEKSNSSITL